MQLNDGIPAQAQLPSQHDVPVLINTSTTLLLFVEASSVKVNLQWLAAPQGTLERLASQSMAFLQQHGVQSAYTSAGARCLACLLCAEGRNVRGNVAVVGYAPRDRVQ